MTSDFFHIGHRTTVGCLVGKRIAESGGNRMSGKMFHVCCKMQQMMFVAYFRMNRLDCELAVGKRSRLVEHHRTDVRQRFHIIRTFYKNAVSRRSANSTEKRQRNANNQRTRAGNNQKRQRPIKPSGKFSREIARNYWWHKGKRQCCKHHHRRVNSSKFRNECLAFRFAFARIFHQFNNF